MRPPSYLYKIVSLNDWEQSQQRSHVILPSLDQEFIHLALDTQVDHVLTKFWPVPKAVAILKVEVDRLLGRLVFEANPGGSTKYYHLYEGSIPLDSVVDVIRRQ